MTANIKNSSYANQYVCGQIVPPLRELRSTQSGPAERVQQPAQFLESTRKARDEKDPACSYWDFLMQK